MLFHGPVALARSQIWQSFVQKRSEKSQDVYAELLKLDDLKERGILTEAEFDAEKKKLLESN